MESDICLAFITAVTSVLACMFFGSPRYPTAFIREAERRSSGYDTAMEEGGLEHHSRPYGVYGLDIGNCCKLVEHAGNALRG